MLARNPNTKIAEQTRTAAMRNEDCRTEVLQMHLAWATDIGAAPGSKKISGSGGDVVEILLATTAIIEITKPGVVGNWKCGTEPLGPCCCPRP